MEKDTVHILELRRLLYELKDLRPDISIRFRLIGAMWQPNYSAVVKLTETGAIFNDVVSNSPYTIHNLNDVVQFELETRFQQYSPYFHYTVERVTMQVDRQQVA